MQSLIEEGGVYGIFTCVVVCFCLFFVGGGGGGDGGYMFVRLRTFMCTWVRAYKCVSPVVNLCG